jgi:Na+/melibiose symporter-like transporter
MQAFWSAMLNAHIVLLSVAVALPAAVPSANQWQFRAAGVAATVCMVALLLNFAAAREQYREVGRRLLEGGTDLAENERRRDVIKGEWRYRVMGIVEGVAAVGLAIEGVLLVSVLIG